MDASYIIFLLKAQPRTLQYEIRLDIENSEKTLCLTFQHNGIQPREEKEELRLAHKFFRQKGNPFLLSLNQIFAMLRSDKYSCEQGCNGFNFIEIKRAKAQGTSGTPSNIIKFPARND